MSMEETPLCSGTEAASFLVLQKLKLSYQLWRNFHLAMK